MSRDARRDLADQRIESLIESAIVLESDANERWAIIREIHARPTQSTFEALVALSERSEAEAQLLACDSLSQLGYDERSPQGFLPFRSKTLPILLGLLDGDDAHLVAHAVSALGHQGLDGLVDRLRPLARHPSLDVRSSLAAALCGREDDESIELLIQLSSDEEDGVRDWATFGIGTQCDRADAKILDALRARMNDPHEDTRCEALVGLASKKDPSAKQRVYEELGRDTVASLVIEAARHYADRRFLAPLERWRTGLDPEEDAHFSNLLEEAIAACRADNSGE